MHALFSEAPFGKRGQVGGEEDALRVGVVLPKLGLALRREEQQSLSLQVQPCWTDQRAPVTQGA